MKSKIREKQIIDEIENRDTPVSEEHATAEEHVGGA